ncbi:hypothetical protein SGGMMB4_05842 (plasmid) [Sodalis glossinidius str. 'morsitans']|uniref:Uncharacterized protein n=1 Tax=Sodalis glossinidius (strain morsitans) TaxID=343509 RepID=A0A193QPK1_SODGM|nr:hypothetical protein SGGMMB4_05842 [Sodalis glossinidius str. 'morsitans']
MGSSRYVRNGILPRQRITGSESDSRPRNYVASASGVMKSLAGILNASTTKINGFMA